MVLRLVCGLAVVFGLVCASAGSVHAGGGPTLRSDGVGGVLPPKSSGPKTTATALGPDNLSYHGGPVMHSNTTYAIYWLPSGYSYGSNTANYESTLNQFLTDVAHDSGSNSNVYAVDPQYYDTVGGGYHFANYSSTFAGSVVDTNPFPASGCTDPTTYHLSLCLTQDQEIQEIYSVISAQGWPVGNTDVQYFLFTPQNVTSCTDSGGTSCAYRDFCAYHSAFTLYPSGANVVWANMPWLGGTNCDPYTHPNGSDADPTIGALSHEHNEAITDPLLTGWYDSGGNEVADKCAWIYGPSIGGGANESINGHPYLIQEEWDNSTSQCVQTFTPPTPTVTSLSPTFGKVGATVTITGTGFVSPSAVKFNGKDAASYTIVSPTQLTATPAAGSTSGPVTVVTPGGTATSPSDFTVRPTITSFAPTHGPAGTSVTITGTNFTGATAVTFGGTPADSFSVDSPTQITATIATGSTTGQVAVTTPGGTGTSTGSFTVAPVPVVASLSPETGGTGTSVTVTGSGFTGVTSVTFGGIAAASFSLVSDTMLTAVVPIAAATGPIAVTTLGGTGTSADTFTYVPAPTVSSFTPTAGPTGTGVTISGTNLTGATAVQFNGTPADSFHVVSATQINAVVAAGATSGAVSVTTPGGTATSSGSFTVIPTPTIAAISPTSGPVGTNVTIQGTSLTGAAAVKFNGTDASSFTIVSNNRIDATVAPGTTSGPVTVTSSGGTATSTDSFTVVPAPTVDSFTPASGPAGTSVTIAGTNLTGASAVTFDGTAAASYTVDSATQITAVVALGTTSGVVSVTTPGGVATSSGSFTVIQPPTVSSFTPATGPVGTSVTIAGTNLTGASAVTFDGTAAASYTVDSATQITATVAPGTTSGTIAVTTVAGTATSSGSFTVIQPPTVTGVTPASGPVGTSVTITGTSLTGATAVAFGGTAAASYTVDSATQITATVASGTTSGAVSVTTVAGTATSSGSFTVVPAPTVTGFTPTSGLVGTSVTITGTNLIGATAVTFHGTAAASYSVDSDTQITAVVAAGTAGGAVSVTTPGGTATSTGSFTVLQAPTITFVSPGSGAVGAAVTITGTNLAGATAVAFNGTAASYTVNSATQIGTTVPAGATTGTVTVTTAGGTATSAQTFIVYLQPTITNFSPTTTGQGNVVAINGTNLTGATSVKLGGVDAAQFYGSDTQIVAIVGTGATGPITVQTPGGTATSAQTFTFVPPPTITTFTPATGPVGTAVTVTGTNFTNVDSVKFNGTAAASYSVDSATQITARVAAGTTSGAITVATLGGTATSSGGFGVIPAPTISSFTPTSGGIGSFVTITGTNLSNASSVTFNGTPAQNYSVESSTQIDATPAAGTTTGVISVTTPGGTAASSGSFTVIPAPTISSFTPTTARVGPP